MTTSILGTRVQRVEDPALLRGAGTFIDNMTPDGLLHLRFLRSQIAHARIVSINTEAAKAAPKVVAIYTSEDLQIPSHHAFFPLNQDIKRPPLAQGTVNFVGDPLVAVIAETKEAAEDAIELIEVDYEALPPVVGLENAVTGDAFQLFDNAPHNIAAGYRDAQHDHALDGADHVVRARFVNQRVAVVPLEGNAILVQPVLDNPDRVADIWVSTQMPHNFANLMAKVFDLPPSKLHVIAPHVGGAFGGKAGVTAEHSVVLASALKLGRPVKWVETRSENLVAMPHGRDQIQYVELGLKANGKIVGLRCSMLGDAGAYGGFGGGLVLGSTRTMSQGTYAMDTVSYSAAAVITNTTPVGAFRGAGRPEAAEFLERIIDIAADELDIDPIELRKINLIPTDHFPYTTHTGATYDSGDYLSAISRLEELVDYKQLRNEQRQRIEQGSKQLLGIGVSVYVEITAAGGGEYSEVRVLPSGRAEIRVGTSAHGQGHATAFSMLVSETLGIALEQITFVQSDTELVKRGAGTGGSRSLQLGGSAVKQAAIGVLEQAKNILARRLEASPEDVVVGNGYLEINGVPSTRHTWEEVSKLASEQSEDLFYEIDFNQSGPTFPFGAHMSVVEVDVETGLVTPLSHISVDDCGSIVNPLLVEGQQHGGAAQGISQVLYEYFQYDEAGNPLTTNLADYQMPAASELPEIRVNSTITPTPLNPLGVKGIGESGTVGATPAIHNAIIDALSHLGVKHIDMPCTPQRIWKAINNAGQEELWREPPTVFNSLNVRGSTNSSDAENVDI